MEKKYQDEIDKCSGKDIPPMTIKEQWKARRYLAMSHEDGKCHIYAEDGELQCNNSLRHGRALDFRREPFEELLNVVILTRMKEYKAFTSSEDFTPARAVEALKGLIK